MPSLANAGAQGKRFTRYFTPVPNIQTWDTKIVNVAAASRSGAIVKGQILKDTSGTIDICTVDDTPRYYVYEVRKNVLGQPSKTNLIESGDAGQIVVIDLDDFPELIFEITEDDATYAGSIYGVATTAGNAVSLYYFSLFNGTTAGLTDNDQFGPNTPSPYQCADSSTATTTSTGKKWVIVSMNPDVANNTAPFGYFTKRFIA